MAKRLFYMVTLLRKRVPDFGYDMTLSLADGHGFFESRENAVGSFTLWLQENRPTHTIEQVNASEMPEDRIREAYANLPTQ